MWHELVGALGLLLVLEGLLPFLNPAAWRRAMLQVVRLSDGSLRTVGLASMLLGVATLYFLR